eukprot:scaffold4223_cov189-Amphora_coffeaeformis.AAC.37
MPLDCNGCVKTRLYYIAKDGGAMAWPGTISYCEELDLVDQTEWHLSNVHELQSIVDYSRSPDMKRGHNTRAPRRVKFISRMATVLSVICSASITR